MNLIGIFKIRWFEDYNLERSQTLIRSIYLIHSHFTKYLNNILFLNLFSFSILANIHFLSVFSNLFISFPPLKYFHSLFGHFFKINKLIKNIMENNVR